MRWVCWLMVASVLTASSGCSCSTRPTTRQLTRSIKNVDDEEPELAAAPLPKPAEAGDPPAQPAAAQQPAAQPAPVKPMPAPMPVPVQDEVDPPSAKRPPPPEDEADPPSAPRARLPDEEVDPPSQPAKNTPTPKPVPATIARNADPSEEPTPQPRSVTPAEPDTRQAIPDDAAQQAGRKILAELYKGDYDRAKTPQLKLELAKKLFAQAEEMSGDATGHYLLLKLTRDLAVQGGDVNLALGAIDGLAASFQHDGEADKLAALTTLSKSLRSQNDATLFLEQCRALQTAALDRDDFELALKAIGLGDSVARRGKMQRELDEFDALRKTASECKSAFAPIPAARAALAKNLADADANLALGKYLCFYRRDWDQGLPHLALGSDVKLKIIAQIDSATPSAAAQQAALGDQWYELAISGGSSRMQSSLALRAAYWYELAHASLPAGLIKSRVHKRLSEITSAFGEAVATNTIEE